MTLDPDIAARLKRNADGLFTAVVQERGSGDVLMVAWMDDEALARTLETREATYFSRSRGAQWVKGATSGHTQHVHSVRLDCDGDTVLLVVDQVGGACHTGRSQLLRRRRAAGAGRRLISRGAAAPARHGGLSTVGSLSTDCGLLCQPVSAVAPRIARMFDVPLPGPEDLATAEDSMVIAAITGWACVEAAASARRLAAIAELVRRRAGGPTDGAQWSCDNWDAMAAEVGAALHVSHGMASGQMYLGVGLRDRLPKVAAVFAEGMISARLVAAIVWRTDLIKDEAALVLADQALAEEAMRFGPLSVAKTEHAIDAIVDRYDPAALRRRRAAARGREVVIDAPHSQDGTTNVWGTLYATDAVVLDRRLMQLAHGVCDDDPRTIAQRRADALGALAAGAERLACGCGNEDCPAGVDVDSRARSVVVHVVADESALTAAPDPHLSGKRAARAGAGFRPRTRFIRCRGHTAGRAAGGWWCGAGFAAGRVDPWWRQDHTGGPSGERSCRVGVSAVGRAAAVYPVPGFDLSVPGMRSARGVLRC